MVLFETSAIVALESLLHAARLCVEYTLTYDRQTRDVVAFLLSVVFVSTRIVVGDVVDGGAWETVACALPAAGLVVELAAMGLYSFAVLVVALTGLVDPCFVRLDFAVVALLASELHGGQLRSNMLRLASLLALLVASASTSLTYARYAASVAVELASWATERYMVPWDIPGAKGHCGGYATRFTIGFVIGAHVCNGSEPVYLRPAHARRWLPETLEGLAVREDRAFLRYKASPSGVLCAYIEGMGLVPYRMSVNDDRSVDVYVLGVHAFHLQTDGWEPSDPERAFVAASRFPFRRLLLGVLLRTSVAPASAVAVFTDSGD